jgi:hypothetical protein
VTTGATDVVVAAMVEVVVRARAVVVVVLGAAVVEGPGDVVTVVSTKVDTAVVDKRVATPAECA